MSDRSRPAEPDGADAVTVGIDLGGTGTRLAAVDRDGAVRARRSVTTRREPGVDASSAVTGLAELILATAGNARLTAVGVGASGPVDPAGIIRNDATLPAYSHIPLVPLLADRLGVPSVIDNDAATAALGENAFGAGRQSPALLAVTLGTGIGVAMLHGSTPLRGSDGMHPEAGHIPVPGPPAPCYCGLATCFEQLASRRALDRLTGGATEDLAIAASAGDEPAREIFDRYAGHVGAGLATLTTVLRPARVVIGGSVARYLPLLMPGIDRALSRPEPFDWRPPVVAAALGEYSGAIGAAVLARTTAGAPSRPGGLAPGDR